MQTLQIRTTARILQKKYHLTAKVKVQSQIWGTIFVYPYSDVGGNKKDDRV